MSTDTRRIAVASVAPEQFRGQCPDCRHWTPVVSDARTARQAADACCRESEKPDA